jgi:hypothetical protein
MSMGYEQIDGRFDFTARDLFPETATSERKRNNSFFSKDFYLEAKTRIWP